MVHVKVCLCVCGDPQTKRQEFAQICGLGGIRTEKTSDGDRPSTKQATLGRPWFVYLHSSARMTDLSIGAAVFTAWRRLETCSKKVIQKESSLGGCEFWERKQQQT